MNSPPEALSPSPSTPSSGSPSPDDNIIPQPAAPATPSHAPLQVTASPKRRLPVSSASVFAGRENKSRKRDSASAWDQVRTGEISSGSIGMSGGRAREELVDTHMVDYMRNMYGDPFDDTMFEKRNLSS